jgi:hypothetical protein
MECHHWISVWACAVKLAKPKVRAERVSLSFMKIPEKVELESERYRPQGAQMALHTAGICFLKMSK